MVDERQRMFLAMLEPVYDRLSRYALGVTRNEADAEDLVSETVLIAFEKFEHLERSENTLRYLITIASRLHRRKRYRNRRQMPFDPAYAMEIPDPNFGPEQAAEVRIVMEALEKLPEKTRETMVLFEVSDFSMEEIRKIQGGTLSGVKSRLKRGREQMAQLLGVQLPTSQRTSTQPISDSESPETYSPHLVLAQEHYVH